MSHTPLGQKRPPLPLLWVERQRVRETIAEVGVGRFPNWAILEREAAEIQRQIEAGSYTWDPKPLYSIESQHVFGDWEDFLPPFSINNMQAFIQLPSVNRLLRRLNAFIGSALKPEDAGRYVALTAHECFLLTMWERYNRRVYVLDPVTYELLANTELPDLPAHVLRVPLPSFYLVLPPVFSFAVQDDPRAQPVEGVLVAFDHIGDDSNRSLEMTMLITGKSPEGAYDDNVSFVSGLIGPNTKLTDIVFSGLGAMHPDVREEFAVLIPRAVLGLCLYLMSEHPYIEPVPPRPKRDVTKIKNPAKRRKAEKRNAEYSSLGYFYVGRGFRELTVDPEAPRPDTPSETPRRKLDHQVWVTGHWRRQPYGPGRQYRKFIWIKPHLRGPDRAEELRIRASKIQQARRR